MTDLVLTIGTETFVDDTSRADGTVKRAIDRAPEVLPEAIARLVGWYLTRDYVVYQDDVANAVLALPAPAVDREKLARFLADYNIAVWDDPDARRYFLDFADALIAAGLVR